MAKFTNQSMYANFSQNLNDHQEDIYPEIETKCTTKTSNENATKCNGNEKLQDLTEANISKSPIFPIKKPLATCIFWFGLISIAIIAIGGICLGVMSLTAICAQSVDVNEDLMMVSIQIDDLLNETKKLEMENLEEQKQVDELKHENIDQQMQIEVLKDNLDRLFLKSCTDLKNMTSNYSSGFYLITLDNFMPFEVYCNVLEELVETIFFHNYPTEVQAKRCEPPRCAAYNITYGVGLEQISAVIQQSAKCRQFIKYRCIYSLMFQNKNPTYATWLSRDGTSQIYWGGATSRRDRFCACGETNSCVNTTWKCNCDSNLYDETSDEGFLTDRNTLPVKGVQFGDLGIDAEKGWFTLGPLICSG